MSIYLAIDLGSFSTRAAFDWRGEVKLVPAPQGGGFSFPSSVYLTKNQELLVGQAAELRGRMDESHYCRGFKRSVGTRNYVLGGEEVPADAMAMALLARVKAEADRVLAGLSGDPFTGAILTVPPDYSAELREHYKECGRQLGFGDVAIMDEPCVAAFAYEQQAGWEPAEGEALLVCDLGTGCTVSLVRRGRRGWDVHGESAYQERGGAAQFDRAILEDLLPHAPELCARLQTPGNDASSSQIIRAVMELHRELKTHLTSEEEVVYTLPETFEEYTLTREALGRLIRPGLEATAAICRQVVEASELEWSHIAGVLLTGSSARLPGVAETLDALLPRPALRLDDPETAVCRGAAALVARWLQEVERSRAELAEAFIGRCSLQTDDPDQREQNLKVLRDLLEYGVSPNVTTDNGNAAILFARDPEIVQLLLESGADPNPQDTHVGFTLLHHLTVDGGPLALIRLLLEAGANPNVLDTRGNPPLMYAALYGHPEAAQLLLAAGAGTDYVDQQDGGAPVHLALLKGHGTVAQLLIRAGADLNIRNSNGDTPLAVAAFYGDPECVRLCLQRGADPNAASTSGNTALYYAAHHGHEEVARVLLIGGADPDLSNSDDSLTPLMIAAWNGHPGVARILLRGGAHRHRQLGNGITAYRCAERSEKLSDADRRQLLDLLQ